MASLPPSRQWPLALACMPGLIVIMITGLLSGQHLSVCLLALSGAFTVGFGAFKKLTDYPLAPMLIVAMGMGVAAWSGSLLGNHFWLLCLAAALMAATCALMSAIDGALWWITLQWSIALLVAGAFPGNVHAADHRALFILLGAAVEIASFVLFARFLSPTQGLLAYHGLQANLAALRASLLTRFRVQRYGGYCASVVVMCLLLVHHMGLQHGYWAPMTALVVLKAHPGDTLKRGVARMVGTLGGCLLAAGLGAWGISGAGMGAVGLLCAFMAYGVQGGRYSLFTLFVTATVITTAALAGAPEWQAATDRMTATCIGGGLAIVLMSLETWLGEHLARRRDAQQAA